MEYVESKPCSKKKPRTQSLVYFRLIRYKKRLFYFLENHFNIILLLIKYL